MSVFSSDVNVDSSALPTGAATDASVQALTKPSDTQLVDGSAHTQPISAASLPLPSGAATDATVATLLTNTQLRASPVPVSGTVTTSNVTSNSITVTRVATSTTSGTALASNASRKKAIIATETGTTYVLFGAGTASATNYTYALSANTVLEILIWTGAIQAVRSAGSGNIQVTEMV